jgi:hypothetical protein
MKRYLVVFVPFAVCTLLALVYANMQPQDYPHPSYPYRTPGVLWYLSTRWFIIGIVLSGVALSILLFHDIFNAMERYFEKRSIERDMKRGNPEGRRK